MKDIPFVLRDHREELHRRWAEALRERVTPDYRELLTSPLGERSVRVIVDELIAVTQAEEYEVPAILRRVDEQATAEAAHRITLGFTLTDVVGGLHVLRGTVIDVLLDALVLDEMPSFGDSLQQLKRVDAFLDRLVVASIAAVMA